MEKKIRIMRKVLNVLMLAALVVSFAIHSGYAGAIAGMIGVGIGLALKKRTQEEPDEMALQGELFSVYVASSVVMAFLIIMSAAHGETRLLRNPYFQVMCVWLAAWGGFKLLQKKARS